MKPIVSLSVCLCLARSVLGATLYVAPGGDHNTPFGTWQSAATNIQSALDAASDNDLVLVTNHTYILSAGLVITNALTLRGVGPERPVCDGNGATRCLTIEHPYAVVENIGFTGGADTNGPGGGGAYLYGGTLRDCMIVSNRASGIPSWGGGVMCEGGAILERCIIERNDADSGGGVFCFDGLIQSCVIVSNTAGDGAGLYGAGLGQGDVLVENCTVVRNIASSKGGGVCSRYCDIVNTIVFHNTGGVNSNYYQTDTNRFLNCCLGPVLPGAGNIGSDPFFADINKADYRLQSGSPCVDGGTAAVGALLDIDAVPLGLDGNGDGTNRPDIGAHEYVRPGTDSDGDRQFDEDELVAGTDATNAASFFGMTGLRQETGNIVMSWTGIDGRRYTVMSRTNLLAGTWTNMPDFTDIPGAGGVMEYSGSGNGPGPRYYRIRAER